MLKGLGCFKHVQQGFCVVAVCHGKTDGRDFYAFVAIEPQNYSYFKRRYQAGERSDFEAFGFELMRGWGTEPTYEVIDHISRKHSVEFGVSENFLNGLASFATPQAKPISREWYASQAFA